MLDHQLYHGYLLSKGMHPMEAKKYVEMAGSGIVDWVKKNRKAILSAIAGTALTALGSVGAYAGHRQYQKRQPRAPMFHFDDEGYGMVGGNAFTDWLKKHKKTILKVLGTTGAIAGTILGAKKGYDKYDKYRYIRDNADSSGYVNL